MTIKKTKRTQLDYVIPQIQPANWYPLQETIKEYVDGWTDTGKHYGDSITFGVYFNGDNPSLESFLDNLIRDYIKQIG